MIKIMDGHSEARSNHRALVVGERVEVPPFHDNRFVDVSSAVKSAVTNRRFDENEDVGRFIPGWGDIQTERDLGLTAKFFCSFSVPPSSKEGGGGDNETVSRQVHTGMGRGISGVYVGTAGAGEGDRPLRPGDLGIFDPRTGIFYIGIGEKGNGPTAEELMRVMGSFPGASYRIGKAESWGLLYMETALLIEQSVLDDLAGIGFRMGQVLSTFGMDRGLLVEKVAPFYEEAGLSNVYNLEKELAKAGEFTPAIMVRLIGGVRADVLENPEASPDLISWGIYGFSSEIERAGMDGFIEKYKIPEELRGSVEAIEDYNFSEEMNFELSKAYLEIAGFLMWRNYFMQDEYNAKFPLSDEDISKVLGRKIERSVSDDVIGPLWLNYKPGDWDVSALMYDVDVFKIKMRLAATRGVESVRVYDREGILSGLESLARALGERMSEEDAKQLLNCAGDSAHLAYSVHSGKGFLDESVKRLPLYSDSRVVSH